MKQGERLTAKGDFQFKSGGKGRAVVVRAGQKFWVTNSMIDQAAQKVVMIDREGKGHISHGYAFTPEMIEGAVQLYQALTGTTCLSPPRGVDAKGNDVVLDSDQILRETTPVALKECP